MVVMMMETVMWLVVLARPAFFRPSVSFLHYFFFARVLALVPLDELILVLVLVLRLLLLLLPLPPPLLLLLPLPLPRYYYHDGDDNNTHNYYYHCNYHTANASTGTAYCGLLKRGYIDSWQVLLGVTALPHGCSSARQAYSAYPPYASNSGRLEFAKAFSPKL